MLDFFGGLETTSVDVEGVRLALLGGSPDGAPRAKVLLLHGFTSTKEDFALLIPELVARGFEAWSYDLRGHFDSEGTGPVTLQQFVDDTVAVLHALGEGPWQIVAHSAGGMIGLHLAAQYPDLVGSLTLMCSGPAGVVYNQPGQHSVTLGRLNSFCTHLRRDTPEQAWDHKAGVEHLDPDNPFVQFLRQRFLATDVDAMLSVADLVRRAPDVVDDVRAHGVRCYWCFGDGDGSWSQDLQRRTAARLGAPVDVISDSRHTPYLENVDETADVLERNLG